MTPRIQVLPREVVERIAAGEVVERPASVVKELVENSIDAGARRVRIETEAGGKGLIRVADDGEGMTGEEAELALQRHATSKLRAAADLFNLRTLGFRGEALPSIAAVAELEIVTRRADVAEGTRLLARAGQLLAREVAAAPVGTTVAVRQLFFPVPARQKFLKSDAAEAEQIADLVQRLALANPGVAFTLTHGDREVLRTPGGEELLNTVVALLGRAVARDLVPVAPAADDGPQVSGFAGLPTLSRATRAQQLFFVNGRTVRSPLFYRALDDAYRSSLPSGRKAVAVVFLQLDPADVDVNVHPSKLEVRFRDEPGVQAAIRRAVAAAVGGSTRPATFPALGLSPADTDEESAAPRPPADPVVREPDLPFAIAPREPADPFAASPNADLPFAREALRSEPAPPWERFRFPAAPTGRRATEGPPEEGTGKPAERELRAGPDPPAVPRPPVLPLTSTSGSPLERPAAPNLARLRVLGQAQDLFILAEGGGQLWIIDQHVAHERVLFDRLTRAPREGGDVAEALLVPVALELGPRQALAVAEHREQLAELGFQLEPFGPNRVQARAVPRSLLGRRYEQALRDMIDELTELSQGGQVRLRGEQLAAAAAGRACKAAVKAGMPLTREEMERLLAELARTAHPHTCPHGRPVFLTYEQAEVVELFGGRQCE